MTKKPTALDALDMNRRVTLGEAKRFHEERVAKQADKQARAVVAVTCPTCGERVRIRAQQEWSKVMVIDKHTNRVRGWGWTRGGEQVPADVLVPCTGSGAQVAGAT